MTPPAWFLALCGGGHYSVPRDLGDGWALATEQHVAVAYSCDGAPLDGSLGPHAALMAPLAEAPRWTIDAAALVAFIGAPRPPAICDDCEGSGTRTHVCDCVLCTTDTEACDCDGGTVPPRPAPFSANGYVFDAALMARALVELPPGEVRCDLVLAPVGPGRVLALDCPDRRVRLIQRINTPTDGLAEIPWRAC